MEWLPRTENERADKLSRIIDNDDWGVSDECFKIVDDLWGPHTVDRFASYYNKKLPRFNSRFWNPESEGIDAFALTWNWDGENNWVVHPISIVPRVIFCMQHVRVAGTLICPKWCSAPYWPMLFPDGYNPIRAVVGIYEILTHPGLFIPGRGRKETFIVNIQRSSILAIRLNFRW